MAKVKIKKDDKYRVLLTELLPYEVPMLFSNEGFYDIVSKGNFDYFQNKIIRIKNTKEFGIPFTFDIKKSTLGESRTLSIIHPINQLSFIDLYNDYDSLMLYLSSKSPFSLRRISKVAKFCYSPDLIYDEEPLKSNEVELEPEILDKETRFIKSYFTYKPIDLIYKFYTRYEFQRLEQKFNYLLEFDISKCFYNIYTHSITWAVKDKESAKRNSRKDSFENRFDKIMQQANYNETNGIVVGPEISRIFAEVILQQIDLNIFNSLTERNIKVGEDYEIRRYVDDYFVFTNDEDIANSIHNTCKKKLEEYKLYINESKTRIKSTPFITNIAIGKRELDNLLKSFFDKIITIEKNENDNSSKLIIENISRPYTLSKRFINEFQCIVGRNGLKYDILSKDIVRYSKKKFILLLKKYDKNNIDKIQLEKYLLFILDIIFYAFSLNINSSTTFKISQLVILLYKFLNDKPEDLKHSIFMKIYRETDFVITNFQKKVKDHETNIETLNLIIALTKINDNYHFSEEKLRDLFKIKSKADFIKFNYFHYITIIYYIKDNSNYSNLLKDIEKSVERLFNKEDDPFSKAEHTMLFFDYIKCPYISNESKIKVVRESNYEKINISEEIEKINKYDSWFMDWKKDINLERILKKKDWGYSG